jgi:hypothetical protein
MPLILSCILAKKLGESNAEHHWKLRQFATLLIARICKAHGDAYPTLRPRVTKTLLRAFLDPRKPLVTHYGAIIGLASLGREVIRVLLLPNLKQYGEMLRKVHEEGDVSDVEVEFVTNAIVVSKCFLACAPFITPPDQDAASKVLSDVDTSEGLQDIQMKESLDYGYFNEAIQQKLDNLQSGQEAMDTS